MRQASVAFFHQYAGMPPIEYRNQLRISRAVDLLRTGMFTVNQVAEDMGFSDPSFFTRTFRKVTGVNPGNYKDKSRPISRPGSI